MISYKKSIANDFVGNDINIGELRKQIIYNSSIITSLHGVSKMGDEIRINFESALSAPEVTALDTLVSNYVDVIYYYVKEMTEISNVNPTVNEDKMGEYAVGSRWLNTSTNELFILFDNTIGSALWKKILLG